MHKKRLRASYAGMPYVSVAQQGYEKLTSKNILECLLDIGGIQGRSLDEGKVVLLCAIWEICVSRSARDKPKNALEKLETKPKPNNKTQEVLKGKKYTSKGLRLLCGDSAQMTKIALVSNEHDNNVAISMVTQFLKCISEKVYLKNKRPSAIGRRSRKSNAWQYHTQVGHQPPRDNI
jgi:hypothetical protein